jgi:transcription initiation factor TFIIH subunit 1
LEKIFGEVRVLRFNEYKDFQTRYFMINMFFYSEYFHRDRGRVGVHIGQMNEQERLEMERMVGKKTVFQKEETKERASKKDDKTEKPDIAGDDARLAAAAGSDDIFSHYDSTIAPCAQLGTQLAAGQFDLASTAETERGERYLAGSDLHPTYAEGQDSRGARVIDKYNRHWAIVLHPNESRNSKAALMNHDNVEEDRIDREMSDLVGYADASENHADHSRGRGEDDDDTLELTLHNLGGYSGKFSSDSKEGSSANDSEMAMKYTKYLAATLQATTEPLLRDQNTGKVRGFVDAAKLKQAFPEPKIGRGLLEALSKKMAADSQTEADVQKLADSLPESFRNNLANYFRRSSELLRHFFALRSVFSEDGDDNGGIGVSESQRNRLTSIVKGMEKVHGEMYELTRNMDLVESKMFKPIMDQLDWAFKLHREDSAKGRGRGGFVPVAKGGFVPVA